MNEKRTGAGSPKCRSFQEFSRMEPPRTRLWRKQKCSPCAFLPNVSSTARPSRSPSPSGSRLHDVLAFVQGPTGTLSSYRIGWTLKRQSGSHKTLSRPGWPDVVFAFHDGEEIGPRMLARMAKRTGLKPDDL